MLSFREQYLIEFDLETRFIREHIERVPSDKFDWKPNEKSMNLGWLTTFLAVMWSWAGFIIRQDSFEPTGGGGTNMVPGTTAEILALFDRQTSDLRGLIASTDDAEFEKPWTLIMNGKPRFTQPKWLLLRTFIMNHAVHHRAQLGVYLRLLGQPVPAVYNDSADEKGGMFSEG